MCVSWGGLHALLSCASFGAFVTHEIKTYIYYTVVPGVYILLWKA